jgi:putative DNA primase/helicase
MKHLTTIAPDHTPEEIARIEADTLALLKPATSPEALETVPPEEESSLQIMANDSEHARQFVGVHGHRFRYVHGLNRWLFWEEPAGWKVAIEPTVLEVARCYVDAQIEASMKGMEGADEKEKQAAMRAAAGFGNAGKLNALIHLTKSDPKIIVAIDEVDSDPWRVGVGNGSLDLSAGTFLQPTPAEMVTKRMGCDYDPSATCPAWESFLAKVQPDPEVRALLQRWAGYCLTGIVREHKFVFFYGTGSNGKSTFLETLFALYGGYAQGAPEKLIMTNPRGGDPCHEVARLPGVRFLLGCEVSEGMRINESIVKSLVSGDTLTGEEKYCPSFDFNPVAKLNLFGNHRPVVHGTDHGFWRRVILVPWEVQIADGEKDMALPGRLRAELPGILNWCLAGLSAWRNGGLRPPAIIEAATAEYKDASDILGGFITAHLDTNAPGCKLPTKEVYRKYQEWAEESGIRSPWSVRIFNEKMKARGISKRGSHGIDFWDGVGWHSEF